MDFRTKNRIAGWSEDKSAFFFAGEFATMIIFAKIKTIFVREVRCVRVQKIRAISRRDTDRSIGRISREADYNINIFSLSITLTSYLTTCAVRNYTRIYFRKRGVVWSLHAAYRIVLYRKARNYHVYVAARYILLRVYYANRIGPKAGVASRALR